MYSYYLSHLCNLLCSNFHIYRLQDILFLFLMLLLEEKVQWTQELVWNVEKLKNIVNFVINQHDKKWHKFPTNGNETPSRVPSDFIGFEKNGTIHFSRISNSRYAEFFSLDDTNACSGGETPKTSQKHNKMHRKNFSVVFMFFLQPANSLMFLFVFLIFRCSLPSDIYVHKYELSDYDLISSGFSLCEARMKRREVHLTQITNLNCLHNIKLLECAKSWDFDFAKFDFDLVCWVFNFGEYNEGFDKAEPHSSKLLNMQIRLFTNIVFYLAFGVMS